MRIITFLLLFAFVPGVLLGQAPSKSQMQAQLKSASSELNKQIVDLEKQIVAAKRSKEDEATVKALEDQLNILKKQAQTIGGLSKTAATMSDEMIQQGAANNQPANTVPKRDAERIKTIPGGILSDAQLIPYLKNVVSEVEKNLPAKDKQKADELKAGIVLKEKDQYNKALSTVANMCWMNGHPEMGLYLTGKLCLSDISNGNNLNNYSALLVMAGAEDAAIPILQNLNTKYPNNSTILNNLGQAWFGLGDMTKAKKYLDETMHAYALHGQANLTNAKICLSQGRNQEAIESIERSIHENYTSEKEAFLNEAGGHLEYTDIPFPYPGPAAPLGFERFILTIPDYPMDGGMTAATLRLMWDDWRNKISVAGKKLREEIETLAPKAQAHQKKVIANSALLKPYNNKVHNTALVKFTVLHEWGNDRLAAVGNKIREAEVAIGTLREQYYQQSADGCGARLSQARSFNVQANTLWHERYNEYMTFLKEFLGEQARLTLYASTDRSEYELNIALIKAFFLSALLEIRCEFEVGCLTTDPPENVHSKELPDFDELNCTYQDEIFIPPFTTMKFECNKMSTNFEISPSFNYREGVSPYLKFGWEENLNTGRITKGTVEVGGELGVSAGHQEGLIFGPIRAEAKVEGGIGVEITEHGIEEVYIKAGSRSDIGPYTTTSHGHTASEGNYGTEMGIETELSWNAGSEKIGPSAKGNLEGKGFLKGIHISSGPISLK
jgi:hypothetical protein